ncbi:MAG: hypothetical protein ABII07_05770 [Patescibacteria group bacterium]
MSKRLKEVSGGPLPTCRVRKGIDRVQKIIDEFRPGGCVDVTPKPKCPLKLSREPRRVIDVDESQKVIEDVRNNARDAVAKHTLDKIS